MKRFLIAMLMLVYSASIYGYIYVDHFNDIQEYSARSFMFTRPIFANGAMEQSLWHNFLNNKHDDGMGFASQVTVAYQHSRTYTPAENYFLLKCKTVLTVAGDDAVSTDTCCRDIRAEWIGLPSDFSGKFCINPEQQQFGCIVELNQDLSAYFDSCLFDNTWVNVQLPIVWVKNKLNLRQFDIVPGTQNTPGGPTDIVQAFDQPTWNFGKIVCERSTCRLGAIILQMGKAFMSERNGMQVSYYSGLVIPTDNKQNPAYLFDATAGYNNHAGLNAGVRFNVRLTEDDSWCSVCFFANLDDIFFIRNEQCRTLGLLHPDTRCPKPLSRFIAFNTRCPNEQNVPGVNILTRTVRSRPFNMIDFSTGLRFTFNEWIEGEVGYNIWGHGEEKIILRNKEFFYDNFGIAGSSIGNTADSSTIAQQGPNDPVFTPIRECDLDLRSAGAGPALNQKAHGSLGIQKFGDRVDYLLGAGWFLEFPHKNGALKTYGAWAKAGASF